MVSQETADTLVTMLESAVAEGTGGNAAVPGYRVAGKTGTAQSFEGGGVIKNVASFIGIAPADDPRLAVNVVLYDPKTSIYGGAVAAPVFREVTARSLRGLEGLGQLAHRLDGPLVDALGHLVLLVAPVTVLAHQPVPLLWIVIAPRRTPARLPPRAPHLC